MAIYVQFYVDCDLRPDGDFPEPTKSGRPCDEFWQTELLFAANMSEAYVKRTMLPRQNWTQSRRRDKATGKQVPILMCGEHNGKNVKARKDHPLSSDPAT